MRESYWGYWIIALGIFVIVIMMLISNVTTTNTQDYYLIKEVTEASMVDAVDYAYYRESGELRINREKFVENFLRRFSENVSLSTYQVDFYGIYEAPPKASVKVTTKSNAYRVSSDTETFDIVNRVDAILELDGTASTNIDSSIAFGGNKNNNKNNNSSSSGTSSGSISGSTGSSSNGGSNGSSNGNASNAGSGSNGSVTSNPSTSTNNSGAGNSNDTACTNGITDTSLSGMQGTALVSGGWANVYHTVAEMAANTPTTQINPGEKFTIIGARAGANTDRDYWAINYGNGNCGWVVSEYMAINLKQFIWFMDYKITNLSGSIYKSSGYDLPNITGRQLYSNEYSSFVPAAWPFAVKLWGAAWNAYQAGDKLVVYDAYRPKSVSEALNNSLTSLMNSNSTVRNKINNGVWSQSWFLAGTLSAHNTACAVDISLNSGSMPSNMHELSPAAAKYKVANHSMRGQPYSVHKNNYASTMTEAAAKLDKYMTDAGLEDLASEWWHFQDTATHEKLRSVTGGQGANFWSNI